MRNTLLMSLATICLLAAWLTNLPIALGVAIVGLIVALAASILERSSNSTLHRDAPTTSADSTSEELPPPSRLKAAEGALHNLGNVLTSLGVSTTLLSKTISSSKSRSTSRLADLFGARGDSAPETWTEERRKSLQEYLRLLSRSLRNEHTKLEAEIHQLQKSLEHATAIIEQYRAAGTRRTEDRTTLNHLVEESLLITRHLLEDHGVTVQTEFAPLEPAQLPSHRLLQILINLIKNGVHAMADCSDRTLAIETEKHDSDFLIHVRDSGCGIAAEQLKKIFGYGFTTKPDGQGFGLHECSRALKRIGGTLSATSAGEGKGACFTVKFPVKHPENLEVGTQSAKELCHP